MGNGNIPDTRSPSSSGMKCSVGFPFFRSSTVTGICLEGPRTAAVIVPVSTIPSLGVKDQRHGQRRRVYNFFLHSLVIELQDRNGQPPSPQSLLPFNITASSR